MRVVYGASLLVLIATAWMLIIGTQDVRNLSDMARFGALLFQILAPLQLVMLVFLSAIQSASNVSVEKDRQTLVLLLMTRMYNSELVLGKLFSSLLSIGSLLLTAFPIFMFIVLFGGTSFQQVYWSFAVTAAACLAAGSFGTVVAFWREKTFQSLALVLLGFGGWVGICEAIGQLDSEWFGVSTKTIAGTLSPWRAILAASSPSVVQTWSTSIVPFLIAGAGISAVMLAIGIVSVRNWNPNREARPRQQVEEFSPVDIYGTSVAADPEKERHAQKHGAVVHGTSRRVWKNPILWREMRTWAYGKKILFIRFAYWLAAAGVAWALYWAVSSGAATRTTASMEVTIPIAVKPLAPLMLISFVILTALGVTSITSERDGRAIDLLQVTDLSPREFLFGKLFGVLYLGLDLIVLPLVLAGYLWWTGVLSLTNYVYLILGSLVINVFVATLGLHCGMLHASTRTAVSTALGTVFFLFVGVVTCMVMIVSFSGNLQAQLAPFLACMLGGAIGLYVALGWQSNSFAIAIASLALPFAMFYSITSLLLKSYPAVLIAVAFTYGFATMALIIPRLSEFRIATGRSQLTEQD